MSKRRLITFDWALKRFLRSKANFAILPESESNQEARNDTFNRVDPQIKNTRDEIVIVEPQSDLR
ncbi:MAG: hypothetical protein HQL76_12120 [Magnetococcales bacterium]|nr:hypothetical protein [Magnetococcales bacterium]